VRMVVAWCELRDGFRHFRADRIEAMTVSAARYPRGRRSLLKAWRETTGRHGEGQEMTGSCLATTDKN